MDRALEQFIKRNPVVKDQPMALLKFMRMCSGMESDALETARVIGFQRLAGKDSVAARMRQIEEESRQEERMISPCQFFDAFIEKSETGSPLVQIPEQTRDSRLAAQVHGPVGYFHLLDD